jgi:uncharacterized glyoxalase superfamily protein PhnB
MIANRSAPSSTVIPVLTYPDVRAAVAWLSAAFGFEERVRIGDGHRSQLRVGDGDLIVADTHGDRRPPLPDHVASSVMVRVADVAGHCGHARAGGAAILMEPTDMPFGERQYSARDPYGHVWTFTDVTPRQWGGEPISP